LLYFLLFCLMGSIIMLLLNSHLFLVLHKAIMIHLVYLGI
jgi:hypothetical protein